MNGRRIKNTRKRTALIKAAFFLYVCVCLFAIVSLRTAVFNLEYELGKLNRLRADLVRERKMVVARSASLYSTQRIEDTAVKRLGMTMPERENVFFVKRTSRAGPYRASMR